MIGEIRRALTPFYDNTKNRMSFKSRPVLIIAQADNSDYIVLPVSRITRRENINEVYDIKIDPALYPSLNLSAVSYVRTHKQTVVHAAEIGSIYGNMKSDYPDIFLTILEKRDEFSKEITEQALS